MDSGRRCNRLGVALSLPWLQWTRTHVQVLPTLPGEVQRGGEEHTREEGKTKWSHQASKAHQQQRRTRGTMESSRGMHGVTLEVVKIFQQERTRAKKFPAKAACAFVRGESIVFYREVQEELDML